MDEASKSGLQLVMSRQQDSRLTNRTELVQGARVEIAAEIEQPAARYFTSAGTLLAVPLLATFKIFCDRIEPLRRVGSFLGRPWIRLKPKV
jgi:hypothetical protein